MQIGKRVKKLRKKAKMTQAYLALLSGVSVRTITGIESGDHLYEFTLHTLKKILKVFNITAVYKTSWLHLEYFIPEYVRPKLVIRTTNTTNTLKMRVIGSEEVRYG